MEGTGAVVGKRFIDFSLPDQEGNTFTLSQGLQAGPILLAFYPGDFTMVCTKQLCSYRDHLADFRALGINIVGISKNPAKEHARFAEEYGFNFQLLTDTSLDVAKRYECTSFLMLGK